MPRVYLLSRAFDPLLAIFTGTLAYYLHEKNPRSAPPPGHTLSELVGWRWDLLQASRRGRTAALESREQREWETVQRELQAGEGEKR